MVKYLSIQLGSGYNIKLRGGRLKKSIYVDAGKWSHVEVSCREGSTISIDAAEVDGETFSTYIMSSADVKRIPLIGTITEYNDDKALWKKEKVKSVKKDYTSKQKDVLFVLFDNYHAKTREKEIDIEVTVEHPPLEVGDEPLQESFEVDAGYLETIDVGAKVGDVIRVFGRVTKGNDIIVHILSSIYETPDSIHVDKAYWSSDKLGEIDVNYQCTKDEPLLIVFDNGYSLRTTKIVDVSVQVIKGAEPEVGKWAICPFCQFKNPEGSTICENCKAKL